MSTTLTTIQGVQALVCAPEGALLASERDAPELLSEAMHHGAEVIVVPIERVDGDFFRLQTRLAG
jgi:hypothetical protein